MPKGTATIQASRIHVDEAGKLKIEYKGLTASTHAFRTNEQVQDAIEELESGNTILAACSIVSIISMRWEER